MILFIIVYVKRHRGGHPQQTLPRLMLTRVPLETVYEQIDSVVLQLLAESDGLVAAACGPLPVAAVTAPDERRAGGGAMRAGPAALQPADAAGGAGAGAGERGTARDIPARHPSVPRSPRRRQRRARHPRSRAATLFRNLRTTLPSVLQDTVTGFEGICDERRQLADQKRLHHVLHGWLLVHVPLSMALLLLGAVHAVIALRY